MALTVQQSLFEADGEAPMAESARWIEGVVSGDIALGVCVITVAFIGALMLTGRLPLRKGARSVVGCFSLLGAPVIASGLLDLGAGSSQMEVPRLQTLTQGSTRPELPEANYNPYAQASVRDD